MNLEKVSYAIWLMRGDDPLSVIVSELPERQTLERARRHSLADGVSRVTVVKSVTIESLAATFTKGKKHG